MKLTREIKTAILAIVAIAVFIFGFEYLKGKDLFDNSTIVHTKFENSFGLKQSATVSFDGIEVGKVVSVVNDFENRGVIVEFTIQKDVPFTNKSKVKLIKDILGDISLALVPSKEGRQIQTGDEVMNTVDNGLIDELRKSLSGISTDLNTTLKSADTLLTNLNKVVIDSTENGLQNAIAELTKTMKSFKNTSYSLNQMIKDDRSRLNDMIGNFSETGKKFGSVADSLQQAKFGETMEELSKSITSLNSLLGKIDRGEGTLGKMMTDEKLYDNISGATKELESLLKDIKLHPKRYFRVLSKKEIPYKEPENE